ncbi:hypothetical protein VTO73DRAFT_10745 [Trametes versicolor]
MSLYPPRYPPKSSAALRGGGALVVTLFSISLLLRRRLRFIPHRLLWQSPGSGSSGLYTRLPHPPGIPVYRLPPIGAGIHTPSPWRLVASLRDLVVDGKNRPPTLPCIFYLVPTRSSTQLCQYNIKCMLSHLPPHRISSLPSSATLLYPEGHQPIRKIAYIKKTWLRLYGRLEGRSAYLYLSPWVVTVGRSQWVRPGLVHLSLLDWSFPVSSWVLGHSYWSCLFLSSPYRTVAWRPFLLLRR